MKLIIQVIPDKKILLTFSNGNDEMDKSAELSLTALEYALQSFAIPKTEKDHIRIRLTIERTEPKGGRVKNVSAVVTKHESNPKTYHTEETEIFNGAVNGKVSIKVK